MKKGYSLGEILLTMIIVAVIGVAAAPIFTVKKTDKNYENNTVACIKGEFAADLNSDACSTAIEYSKYRKMNANDTLFYFADHGTTAEQNAAREVMRKACDEGSLEVCRYMIASCKKDSSLCDIAGSNNDFDYYLRLNINDGNPGRMKIRDIAKPWYDLGNTNVVNAVENACCNPDLTTACDIKGVDFCPWVNQYGTNWSDFAYSLAVSGGSVYVTGSTPTGTSHIFVMKLDGDDGSVVWRNKYGLDDYDAGFSIAVSGGSVYVTGSETGMGSYHVAKILVMKLDETDGTVVWRNRYGVDGDSAKGFSIAISGGNLFVTGIQNSTPGNADIFVMKLDETDGSVVWRNKYGGAGTDYGNSIDVSGGSVYVAGITKNPAGLYDIFVMRLDETDGSVAWRNRYGSNTSQRANSMAVSGGSIYVTGSEYSFSFGHNILVMKLDKTDGSVVWRNRYGGNGVDAGFSIAVSGGSVYVTGEEDGITGNEDILVMKLDETDGSVVWRNHYGGSGPMNLGYYGIDMGNSIAVSGGSFYVTGSERGTETNNNADILVMRLSTDQPSSNISDSDWTYHGNGPIDSTSHVSHISDSDWSYHGGWSGDTSMYALDPIDSTSHVSHISDSDWPCHGGWSGDSSMYALDPIDDETHVSHITTSDWPNEGGWVGDTTGFSYTLDPLDDPDTDTEIITSDEWDYLP